MYCHRLSLWMSVGMMVLASNGAVVAQGGSSEVMHRLGAIALGDAATGYMQPAIRSLAHTMHASVAHTAAVDPGFHMNISIHSCYTFIPESQKKFSFRVPPELVALGYPGTVETATVFGIGGALLTTSMRDPSGNPLPAIRIPGGINLDGVPFFYPQIDLGSIYGLELSLRGIPLVSVDDIGSATFVGAALKFSPTNKEFLNAMRGRKVNRSSYSRNKTLWQPRFDASIMASYNYFRAGGYVTMHTLYGAAFVSLTTGPFAFYSGGGANYLTARLRYNLSEEAIYPDGYPIPQTLSVNDRHTDPRFTIGASYTAIAFFMIEYSVGPYHTISGGFGVEF